MQELKLSFVTALKNEKEPPAKSPDFLSEQAVAPAHRIHRGLPQYSVTPLVSMEAMAAQMGIKALLVKDESKRFGLNAFKGLGGLYALTRVVCRELGLDWQNTDFAALQAPENRRRIENMVFVTATDGNHGRGVAWAAGMLGCKAHVYMPAGSAEARAQAIREVGRAEATIIPFGYDEAVRYAARMARENGWYLIQDTSWEEYREVPTWIVQGYTTMAMEAAEQMDAMGLRPTHVFVQAGVGAMAGGVVGYLAGRYEENKPLFAVVEPENIPCIYESAQSCDGEAHTAKVQQPTIMAGLNCGEPCTITWPVLRDYAGWYFKCPDNVAAHGMRMLARGAVPVVSGESGAVTAGLAHLLGCCPEAAELKAKLGLDSEAVVLCISTEGDTDPENYRKIVFENEYPFSVTD